MAKKPYQLDNDISKIMTPTLMLLHDHQATIKPFQSLFEKLGFEMIIETSCAHGLERMKTSQINGLLLDLDTFKMDGLNLLTDMREQCIQVPTIVMGWKGKEQLLITALTKGAQDYLLKPISSNVMYDKCLRLFK